ncbi:MAG TPA: hypothetical protein GX506_05275 [Firmicutes bacterium]|nr:hypothetical protein [Bacillota bacterium]
MPDVISLELARGLEMLLVTGKPIRVILASPPSGGTGAPGPLRIVRQRETGNEVELIVVRSIEGGAHNGACNRK